MGINHNDLEEQVFTLATFDVEYLYIALGLIASSQKLNSLVDLSLYIGLQNEIEDRVKELGKNYYYQFKNELLNNYDELNDKKIFDTRLFINKYYKSIDHTATVLGVNDINYKLLITTLLARNE